MNSTKVLLKDGKKLFPSVERFLCDLLPGEMFKTRFNPTVYTVFIDGTIRNECGEVAYLPSQMPVVLLKQY